MSNRIGRMSKRRQKIAWRRVMDAKLRAALRPIIGMPYTPETWRKASALMQAPLDELLHGKHVPPIRIVHESATLAFFSL